MTPYPTATIEDAELIIAAVTIGIKYLGEHPNDATADGLRAAMNGILKTESQLVAAVMLLNSKMRRSVK